jgi:membrane protein DedA with SNARE-associated domain
MPAELAAYITQYGYFAIFALVFLQEIGIPNPVPNELVLLFSGYLASEGILSLPVLFLTVVLADFMGTSLLYFVFYIFGKKILEKKPRWIPIHKEHIDRLSKFISKKDWWGIYLGRLIPYLRGYTSIAAGLLQLRPKMFLTMVLLSAVTWSGGYAIAGEIMGPYWQTVADKIGGTTRLIYIILAALLVFYFTRQLLKWRKTHKDKELV